MLDPRKLRAGNPHSNTLITYSENGGVPAGLTSREICQ